MPTTLTIAVTAIIPLGPARIDEGVVGGMDEEDIAGIRIRRRRMPAHSTSGL